MSLPGPLLPPTPPTEAPDREWYTLHYFGRVEPGRAVQGGYRNPYVLAVIITTLLALVVAFFFLSRL